MNAQQRDLLGIIGIAAGILVICGIGGMVAAYGVVWETPFFFLAAVWCAKCLGECIAMYQDRWKR